MRSARQVVRSAADVAMLSALLFAVCPGAPGAEKEKKTYPTIGTIERLDPRFDALVRKVMSGSVAETR